MNRNLLLWLLLILSANTFAQKVPTPEFSNRPYFIKDVDIVELERSDAQFEQKSKAFGYGGVEVHYTIFSPASSIQFNFSSLPRFIVKVDEGVDVSEIFSVVKAVVKKGKRSFVAAGYGIGGKAKDVSGSRVNVAYKKLDHGIYEIILPEDIAKGEYGFLPTSFDALKTGNTLKIACFGIE